MIGGRDFRHSKFNRATQSLRQAGSSFKPFVYTAAISSGIPASHILVDAPVVLPQISGEEWKPQNFTEEFLGPITIREGLRRSINMIAIKLGLEVGLEAVAQTAQRMGVRTEIERYPSTSIGAAEVIPIQMAEAYSTFATLGTRVRPQPILRVENPEGDILWEPQPERTQVLDSLEARVMVAMLEDVVAKGTGYNVRAPDRGGLPYDVPAAGKTGTTNDATNVWFMGFTPNLMAAIWFGMDRPATIWEVPGAGGATGGGDAAPVWGRFMKRVYYSDSTRVYADSVLHARMFGTDSIPEGSPGAEASPEGEALTGIEASTEEARLAGEGEISQEEGGSEVSELRGFLLPIPDTWPVLPGLVVRQVDNRTGLLASPWCPADSAYTEYYLPGTEPTEFCDLSGIRIRRAP